MSGKPRYVLDACVLYPVVVRDLLLTAAALDLFVPIWSDTIIDNTPSTNPFHSPSWFALPRIGGAHLNSVAPSGISSELKPR